MNEDQQKPGSEREERLAKIALLQEKGIMPFPSAADKTHDIAHVLDAFEDLQRDEQEVIIAGRIRSKRTHGNLSFIDVEDFSGRMQVVLSKKECSDPEQYKPFVKLVDAGDFIQVRGKVFVTQAGQESVMTADWTLLTKALRGMPTDHFGLKDEDERYRRRYVDMAVNAEVRERFVRRAKFWQVMRQFMESKGFLHIETPTLETTTGGAEARPFITHHNDFDLEVYLRISIGELWQKRAIAGGLEKTYEIGRAFRNEGSSPNHLQEFTNMEFYWAYANYRDGMQLVQEMYRTLAQEVYGKTTFEAHGHQFDLADEWREIDYCGEIEERTGINVMSASEDEIKNKLKELGVEHDAASKERLIDNLWKYCRKDIAGPGFLVGHPAFLSPLAKRMQDNPDKVEKFQVILAGAEVGNGYSELNDPIDQAERFSEQQKLLEGGDDEAMMPDWDFVEMLEYGMPPTCGFGAGERLFAFLEGETVRESTMFPLMKPKKEDQSDHDNV